MHANILLMDWARSPPLRQCLTLVSKTDHWMLWLHSRVLCKYLMPGLLLLQPLLRLFAYDMMPYVLTLSLPVRYARLASSVAAVTVFLPPQ